MRGQVSVEYLIIIGIAIGVLLPSILFFFSSTQQDKGAQTNQRLTEIGQRMMSASRTAYAHGMGARVTVEFSMPDAVTRAYVSGNELCFVYETPQGPSEAVFYSIIPLTSESADGNISQVHPGLTRYWFTSQGGVINVTEAT